MNPVTNILSRLPSKTEDEAFETLALGQGVRIERIVSSGQRSEEGFWYEQTEEEWVMVVKGKAILTWKNGEQVPLGAGDYVTIPALCGHRVEWTDPDQETVWLAVYYSSRLV